MYTPDALLDLHERCHRNLRDALEQCRALRDDELNREMPGFGYPTVRLQFHHIIGAEEYWLGVLHGVINADDNSADFPTIDSLEAWRARVYAATGAYLKAHDATALNTAREYETWGGRRKTFTPAHVMVRTHTHIYSHKGQVSAMCRLMGKPVKGLDFPLD